MKEDQVNTLGKSKILTVKIFTFDWERTNVLLFSRCLKQGEQEGSDTARLP
jgi:hypothetical protein